MLEACDHQNTLIAHKRKKTPVMHRQFMTYTQVFHLRMLIPLSFNHKRKTSLHKNIFQYKYDRKSDHYRTDLFLFARNQIDHNISDNAH